MIQIKRNINLIVIHHSATPKGRQHSVEEIRNWHIERGFSDIGYHDVVLVDGSIKEGRDRDIPGAHALGHNSNSIGICLVGDGRDGFLPDQWLALKALVRHYKRMFPGVAIKGHRDLKGAATECPGFDVSEWLKSEGL